MWMREIIKVNKMNNCNTERCDHCPLDNYLYEGIPCVARTRSHQRFCDLAKYNKYHDKIIEKSINAYFDDYCYNGQAKVILAYIYRQEDSGLSVSSKNSATILSRLGFEAKEIGCSDLNFLRRNLTPDTRYVFLQAVWYGIDDLVSLAREFPATRFVSVLHSNIAFLSTEPHIIKFQRDLISKNVNNIFIGCVSDRLSKWWKEAYGINAIHLPNLYDSPDNISIEKDFSVIKLGSFGAMRLQKHHAVAAAASVVIAQKSSKNVELHINTGRHDVSILSLVKNIVNGARNISLVEVPWMSASDFSKYTGKMDLCLQPTSTETFNYVTADAAAYCVPSLVGEAVEWMPDDMKVFIDDPVGIANRAIEVLGDDTSGVRCKMALECYNKQAIKKWIEIL